VTALRPRLSATKTAKRKSSRKVVTTKAAKAKAPGKSPSKATKRAPLSKPRRVGPVRRPREESERVARLFAHASQALGTEVEAREFMATPHPELGGLSPRGAAKTDPGARRVEEILHALEYGLAL
jgi:putative toxin-antitoxin system antitoxin component (TIGR02293 family)